MAMKVIGTGAPRMLTVRFRPCEVGVVLDELHQRAVVTEAAAHAHDQSDAPGKAWICRLSGTRRVSGCVRYGFVGRFWAAYAR